MRSFDVSVDVHLTLRWRHNERDSISNHQPYDCLLNRLFRRRWKKTLKLRVTGLCAGNLPGTGKFPAQMASNAEKVSIWWRHHEKKTIEQTVEMEVIWGAIALMVTPLWCGPRRLSAMINLINRNGFANMGEKKGSYLTRKISSTCNIQISRIKRKINYFFYVAPDKLGTTRFWYMEKCTVALLPLPWSRKNFICTHII